MHGFISTACGRSRSRPDRRRAGQAAEGNRAPSCRAHVVRGRGARRAGQDRAGAHAAHRARRIARRRRAVSRCTIFSNPASRNCANYCRRSWRGRSCGWPSAKAGSAASISAWRSTRPRFSGYLRFLMLAKLRPLAAPRPSLQAGTGANRILARPDPRRPRGSPALALEIAECARLIKGYGDTHARGLPITAPSKRA